MREKINGMGRYKKNPPKTEFFAPKTLFLGLFPTNPPLRTSSVTLVSEPFPKQDKDEVYCRSILRPSLHSLITILKRWSTLDSVTVYLFVKKYSFSHLTKQIDIQNPITNLIMRRAGLSIVWPPSQIGSNSKEFDGERKYR